MAMASPQGVVVDQSFPLQTFQRSESAYQPNYDIERALPSSFADMEAQGVRNRGAGIRNTDDTIETLPNPSPTLMPSSRVDDESNDNNRNVREVSRLKLAIREAWQILFRSTQTPKSRSTDEHTEDSTDQDDPYKSKEPRKVSSYPKGIPQLAAFIESNDSFVHLRRFGRLFIRILLRYEIELTELERKIDELDVADSLDPIMEKRLYGPDGYSQCNDEQRKLLEETRMKLSEYADLTLKYAQLRAIGKSSPRNHKQLLNWIIKKRPLRRGKDDFIFHVDDFVSPSQLAGKDYWIEDTIEALLDLESLSCFKGLFQTDAERRKMDGESFQHYNDGCFMIARNIIMVLLTVGGIAVPVLLLFLQHMSHQLMSTIALVFVLLFAISVASITGARAQDVMFGTATYSGIVLLFLGNVQQSCGGN